MEIGYIILGIVSGIISGMVGIGGGIIMVPALVYFYGFTQHVAQGTAVGVMLPPIGLLAAYVYYKNEQINIPAALFIALGFLVGGYFGAKFAGMIDDVTLKRIFGFFVIVMGIKITFF